MNSSEKIRQDSENPPGVCVAKLWRGHALTSPVTDKIACEVPVALVYNGISHVVMMASPKDFTLFALGFSLSEGIIGSVADIYGMEVERHCAGYEVRIELSSRQFMSLKARRRALAGRTGCGVCGVEQLNAIGRPVPPLPFTQTFSVENLAAGLSGLRHYQEIGNLTGCTHAAGWLMPDGRLAGGYEDIGRHVALDKLLGRRALEGWHTGAVLVSSRASYEMVQKAAQCGVEILFALSATTTLAVEVAQRSNLTLVGFCRAGSVTVYTHPQRLRSAGGYATPA